MVKLKFEFISALHKDRLKRKYRQTSNANDVNYSNLDALKLLVLIFVKINLIE